MYDVFLSHNGLQKPWVRNLYNFLVNRGLDVFFDEQSIPPGFNMLTAIEQALQESRHVVLILTPSSLASRWVAMETQLTVHEDPDGKKGKLVPIVLEKLDFDAIRPSVRALNCIDLVPDGTREERLRFVLRHIGVHDVDCVTREELKPLLLDEPRIVDPAPLLVGGLDDVLDWGWDGVKLLDEFIRLDYETLDDLIPAHEGHSKQWAPIFSNHPDTWRMLIAAPGRIAGYWHFAPLFPQEYNLAKEGRLLDSQITADRIQFFEFPGWYDIYFVQVCLLPQYRKLQNVRLLFETIFSVLDSLAKEGIFIREVCTNAYTDVGRALCRTFRLRYVKEHRERGSVFFGSIRDILGSPIAAISNNSWERYEGKIPPQQRHRTDASMRASAARGRAKK